MYREQQSTFRAYDAREPELKMMKISFGFTQENLSIATVINLIFQEFNLPSKKIWLYDWKGIEITEDADLWKLVDDNEYNRVVFFTKKGDKFNTTNILNLFTIDEPLGQGGFGRVFLAHFADTNEKFAIKFLSNVNDFEYSFKEIQALTCLEHENIIKLYSYCATEENKIALIMDYEAGGTLYSYIRDSSILTEKEGRRILKQILETTKYFHSQEIIHRDLKTENILFSDETHTKIKIIDFGISTILNGRTKAGSLSYIAPEVLSGRDSLSKPSVDIWSIGCILFEMLTGRRMFKGKTKEDTKEKILERKVSFPLHLSLEAVNLIDMLCKLDAKERITIDQALKHPWMTNDSIEKSKVIEETKKLYSRPRLNKTPQIRTTISPNIYCSSNHTLFSPRKKITKKPNSRYILTKVPSDLNDENEFINYNMTLISKYKGNVPGYMEPIGHNKSQKHSKHQMKEYLKSIGYTSPSTSHSKKSISHYYSQTNTNIMATTTANKFRKTRITKLPLLSSPYSPPLMKRTINYFRK